MNKSAVPWHDDPWPSQRHQLPVPTPDTGLPDPVVPVVPVAAVPVPVAALPVPEPAGWVMFLVGAAGLLLSRFRK